ncbi:TetR/AcrR family transcriptional regulator [Pseudoteredinibacter isoporae]|uniref:TetR/AcrR family transcriptional regulator n=1 Tax=Pseudoteredinibacter isoporae TaxID=570281 RepID=UPI003107E100
MSTPSKTVTLDSRQTLIVTATNLFQKQGYYATGLNEILSLAGLPKGSLYHHFRGGKVDLAIACVESLAGQIVLHLQRATLSQQSYSELISQLVRQADTWLQSNNWSCGSLFATLSHEAKPEDLALKASLKDSYRCIQEALAQLLQEQGLSESKAADVALSTVFSLEGALSLSAALGSAGPLKEAETLLLLRVSESMQ